MSIQSLLGPLVALFFTAIAMPAMAQDQCATERGPARTACEEISYQAYRDTSGTPVTRFADHCDDVLRRSGEPLTMRAVPRGQEAWSPQAVALPRLTWAGTNGAGAKFREYGLHFGDGRVVENMELCADTSVWQQALAEAGVTAEMIRSGQVYIALCGENWSHHLPASRILALLEGRPDRAQYSVLSREEGVIIVAQLTSLGH